MLEGDVERLDFLRAQILEYSSLQLKGSAGESLENNPLLWAWFTVLSTFHASGNGDGRHILCLLLCLIHREDQF